jgi:hypothetical protein
VWRRRNQLPIDSFCRVEMSEFLQKVQHTTKSTLVHFDRCKEVIEKLHDDCNDVAKKNADLLSKLRDCDDMVTELVPPHLRKKSSDDGDREDTKITRTSSSRTKKTEAQMLVKNIRKNLDLIGDDHDLQKEGNEVCAKVIDNMLDDVEQRKVILDKQTERPPKDRASKYFSGIDGVGDKSSRARRRLDPLRVKVEQLTEALEVYVHQEKQMTHRTNLSKYQTANTNVTHRNFDEIDEDLALLQRELKREDSGKAMDVARHIVEATRGEREECLKMVDELEKTVKTRRLRLQENAARTMGPPNVRRRVPQRRIRAAKKTDSSFSKKLNDLNNEIRMYMSLEMDQNQRNQAELLKKKQEFEGKAKNQAQEIRKMEKSYKQLEGEREKFKRLYQQEKSTQKSNILKRPTLVGRRSRMTRTPSRMTRSPSISPISRKSRFTTLDDSDDDFDDRYDDTRSRRTPKKSSRSFSAVRPTTRDNFSDREETPPDVRVRSRSRGRRMTPKLPDIRASRH